MKIRNLFAGLVFAVLSLLAVPAKAQDEVPGSQVVLSAVTPASGFICGRLSYPLYCSGVTLDNGGTFWLDSYYKNNSYQPTGFVFFFNSGDLAEAPITSALATKNSQGLVTRLDITFVGQTNDDGGTYKGTATFTFNYVKMQNGSGKGGGYPSYIVYMTTGTITVVYN